MISGAGSLHFGEVGNLAFIPPPLVRVVVEMLKDKGGRPFLTEANTLYMAGALICE